MDEDKKYEKISTDFKARLLNVIASMSLEQMKQEMRLWDTANVKTFCENYGAIEKENYEVCQAAIEVLKEREENEKK